ncbi:HNH endonuclease signature motif containing protein [Oryzihumus leptocrescens]
MHQGDRRQRAAASGSGGVPAARSGGAGSGGAAVSFADRFAAVGAAREALTGLAEAVHQCQGSDLGPAMGRLDVLRRLVEAAQVTVLGEGLERGEVASSTCSTAAGWVLEWAPSYRAGGTGDLVKVAQACIGKPVGAGAAQVLDHGSVQRVRSCVLAGRVRVRCAAVALTEMHKLGPRLTPAALPTVWEGFLAVAEEAGPREFRGLRERIIATHGRQDEFQVRQDRLRHGVSLSAGRADDGMVEYQLRLDPEGASVLEAAIGPLSAPNPVDGISDLRNSDQRRGDALVEACRRSTAAGEAPVQTKAQVFVTMDFESLRDACGSGTVLGAGGVHGNGTLLGPETVRRIACDAAVIPVVLGTQGEVLDLGRTRRLFSPAQLKHLWLRDGGCTIPGCAAPPWWCDGHHVIHWANGGATDVGNAALLCGRHHTIVHQRGWTATVAATGVTWHL